VHLKRFLIARALLISVLAASAVSGCSIQRFAVNKIGDALAGGGSTYAADDDPEFVRAAVPFSLKLVESLLESSPEHQGLLLTAASGFTQYSYAFVQQDADELEDRDFQQAQELRDRARRLYLRARDYGLRGLEARHSGIGTALNDRSADALAETQPEDVPFLYWTAVAWAAAIGVSKDDPQLIGDLGIVDALINRALDLDDAYDFGAIHAFLITYSLAGLESIDEQSATARRHLSRAVELSDGNLAGPYVSFAESVCVRIANRQEFTEMLEQALAIDPDGKREWRLANLIMQKRARWLLARRDELFLPSEAP
jgi:predicted anti-sigma-YlaC factor YlaD